MTANEGAGKRFFDKLRVHRKLSGLDCETRTLVEMFSMADDGKLPGVEV